MVVQIESFQVCSDFVLVKICLDEEISKLLANTNTAEAQAEDNNSNSNTPNINVNNNKTNLKSKMYSLPFQDGRNPKSISQIPN
jgi:hypothetical protein